MAVAVHSSFGTRMPTMGADRYRDPFFFHMVCHPFERNLLWGSDYPHFDCTFPGLVKEVERACSGLTQRARQCIFAENAGRVSTSSSAVPTFRC